MYITLLADDTGGGWAFDPRPDSTPPRVQPAHARHVTMPLCDPTCSDVLTVARATVTLDEAATAAFTAGTPPPLAELHHRAVLLIALPAHRLAVAVGVFTDTYAAHLWWASTRKHLQRPNMSIGVYPLMTTTVGP